MVGAEHTADSDESGELVFNNYLSTVQKPLRFRISALHITCPKLVQFCLQCNN